MTKELDLIISKSEFDSNSNKIVVVYQDTTARSIEVHLQEP